VTGFVLLLLMAWTKLIFKAKMYRSIICFGLIVFMFSSCLKKEKVWETDISTPLFQTDLALTDILADSVLIKDDDDSYILSYDYEFTIDSFGDHLKVPDTINQVTVSLQKLVLSDKDITDTITLREMAPETGLLNGKTVVLPAQEFKNADPQEIDISKEFFKTAKFRKGYLDLAIYNDLPVVVETMSFRLTNKSDGVEIASGIFSEIQPGDSATASYDLAGKEVKGILLGEILDVKTRESSGPVLIDANKGVRIGMNVRDLEPEYATAVFPAQDLVTDTQEVVYNLGKAAITEMMIYSGDVIMTVHSTIEEEIQLDYRIPFSGKNGDFNNPLVQKINIPPAPRGETKIVERRIPLNDYVIQYKGKDPTQAPFFNTVYSELVASIVYSGIERSISLTDSVFIEFGFVDIKPAFAYGDFGKNEFELKEETQVDFLKQFEGSLSLEDMWMSIVIENGFGIRADLDINSIQSLNTKTGTAINLTRPGLIGQTINVAKAANPPFDPYKRNFVLNSSNSNIKSFLENLPDKISTDLKVKSEPSSDGYLTDFVFRESNLKANLLFNIPMQFAFGNLQLTQKQQFDFNKLQDFETVKSAEFLLRVDNDFPIDITIQMEFLDDDENILLTLFTSDNQVAAAEINVGEEKTREAKRSYLKAIVDEGRLDLLREATKVRTRAVFDTPGNSRQKLFSGYKLSTKLSADFSYEQSF